MFGAVSLAPLELMSGIEYELLFFFCVFSLAVDQLLHATPSPDGRHGDLWANITVDPAR